MSKIKIIAVGGGELKDLETIAIDRHIVGLTNISRPRALFVPTASEDSEKYIETFNFVYGRKLGCRTSVLKLSKDRPSSKKIKEEILNADLIYVGGGNTLKMMRIWRRAGVDILLRRTASRGTVLSGISAGAICWFKYGHSDSRRFSEKNKWDYIRVSGLGIVDGLLCPHYHVENRETSLSQMVLKFGGIAFAVDNNAAIEINGKYYRVLFSKKNAKAYILVKKKNKIIKEILPLDDSYKPLEQLVSRCAN